MMGVGVRTVSLSTEHNVEIIKAVHGVFLKVSISECLIAVFSVGMMSDFISIMQYEENWGHVLAN